MYNVRIQLATGYLDVKEDTAFPLNFGIADIRDVSKRAGAFSKTITLVGTKNNHDLLNHYYDVNIVAGTFNINALTKCTVVQNGIPILSDAFVQLLSVNKIQKDSSFEQDIEYSVLIKDQASTFFTDIDTKELKDIDYSDLNHAISSANIYSSFTHDVTDGYKYGLTWNTGNLYSLAEFRPAIYAKVYFDRIFQNAGYNYEWSSLVACGFDKLIIPYSGDLVTMPYSNYAVEETHAADIVSIVQTPYTIGFSEQLTSFTEILDGQNLFNPTTGVYTCPFPASGAEVINIGIDIIGDIQLVNATGVNLSLYNTDYSYSTLPRQRYVLEIQVFRSNFPTIPIFVFSTPYDVITNGINSAPYAPGTTTIISLNNHFTLPISNVNAGTQLTFKIGVGVDNSNTTLHWVTPAVVPAIMTPQLNYTSLKLTANISSNTLAVGTVLNMNQFVPDKIKQKDFVKSIFQMFNLYVEIDTDNANTLILKTRDDFYDSGIEKDWTYKLAKDKEQVLNFLPELASKKLILTYKQDKDTPNVTYYDTTREVYGQVEYIFDNEYVKKIDTKELIFSPSPIGQTTFGAYVPIVAGSSPKTNIRILYDGGMKSCSQYTIIDSGSAGMYGILEYPLMHHYDDALNPTLDINFALCDYMYYDFYTPTDNNLYNSYWRRTINQINTGKMLIAYFNLKEDDIQSLKLNDKIRIDNSWWSINKVIDYDANNKQLTKVELLSTDSEIDFAPFKTKITKQPQGAFTHVYTGVNETIANNTNAVGVGADVIIKGRNNIVMPGVKGIIEGDDGVVTEDGIYRFVDGVNTLLSGAVYSITSGTQIETTSNIDVVASGLEFTPPAGTYKVDFNGHYLSIPGNVVQIATIDLQALTLYINNLTATGTHGLSFGSGETLTAGIYDVAGAMSITGVLTLNGGVNDIFVFRSTGALNTTPSTTVQLTGGVKSANVFFLANGALGLGANNVLNGNFIAVAAAAALGANATFNGRLLSTAGSIAFGAGTISKPTDVSLIPMGILDSFLAFTNSGGITNTALAKITGNLGTGSATVVIFLGSVFNGVAFDPTQSLGDTNVFSLYKGNTQIPFTERSRYYNTYVEDVTLQGTTTVNGTESISVRWRTDIGKVVLANRIFTIV